MSYARGIRAGAAYVELYANDNRLVRGLNRAAKRLKAFGATAAAMGRRIALAGAGMTGALLLAAKSFASTGDAVAKMARRTGFSAQALSELAYAAERSGTNLDGFEKVVGRMQRSIYDAGRGLSTATDALGDLGLSAQQLEGLSPEQQFERIAEALGGVEDPSRRAAIAMTLLGRSGTAILPMVEGGAKGLARLREEARATGQTMTDEDAAAAEQLADAFGRLTGAIKRAVFGVGASLAPVLTDLANRIAYGAKVVIEWIDAHRGLVITALKVAAVVLAAGAAITVLGGIVSGVGAVLGGLATAIQLVGAAIGVLGSIVAALVSPIGLVVAAVAALGAYLLHATGAAGKALGWLAERFGVLAADAGKAWGAIARALAAGEIGLAAKIAWKFIKLEFTRGIAEIKKWWADFTFGLRALLELAVHGMTVAWIEAAAAWSKVWAKVKGFIGDVLAWAANGLKSLGADILAGLGIISDETAEKAKKKWADDQARTVNENTERERKAINEAEEKRRTMRDLAAQEHQRRMADLSDQNQDDLKAAEDELAGAKKEFADAVAEGMKLPVPGADGGGPEGLEDPDKFWNSMHDKLAGAGAAMDLAGAGAKGSITGTFSAAALSGLGMGSTAERTAKATEQTAKHTRQIRDGVNRGGPRFG